MRRNYVASTLYDVILHHVPAGNYTSKDADACKRDIWKKIVINLGKDHLKFHHVRYKNGKEIVSDPISSQYQIQNFI